MATQRLPALGVSLTGGFSLAPSQSFTVVEVAGTTSGGFAGLAQGALVGSFGGTDLFITYTGGNGNDVALFTAGLTGDYNNNDTLDAADYTVWRDAMTAGATELPNDPTPGTVDESDFLYWRAHFGETLSSGAGSAAAVPEPSALVMLLLGLLALLPRRVRQFHQPVNA